MGLRQQDNSWDWQIAAAAEELALVASIACRQSLIGPAAEVDKHLLTQLERASVLDEDVLDLAATARERFAAVRLQPFHSAVVAIQQASTLESCLPLQRHSGQQTLLHLMVCMPRECSHGVLTDQLELQQRRQQRRHRRKAMALRKELYDSWQVRLAWEQKELAEALEERLVQP